MNNWSIKLEKGFSPKNPVFIEGLPGIGNVGKIAVDYMIDMLKAKKVADFSSYDLPSQVFINEENMVMPPSLSLYHKKIKQQDFIFLKGEVQPTSDRAIFEFTDLLLETLNGWGCKQIIATGGIGLTELPEIHEIYLATSSPEFAQSFVDLGVNKEVYGLVGPIIGVSGLIVGLSVTKNLPAVALLVETFIHPNHIGLVESRLLIDLLAKRYSLDIDFTELDEEINFINKEMALSSEEIEKKTSKYKKLKKGKDLNYIG